MSEHQDDLSGLNRNSTLNEKLEIVHRSIKKRFPEVSRIAVALYEEKSNLLRTYLASSGVDEPLVRYESPLGDAPTVA